MIRLATLDDLPAIRQLLTHSNDYPYDAAAVAEEKCFGRGVDGEPATLIAGDFDGIAVVCGRFLRLLCVARGSRRRGVGSALVEHGRAKVIAAEPGNYFTAGVLERDGGFFRRLGYQETGSTWNLHVDLSHLPPPTQGAAGVGGAPPALLAFVEREFGRIWRFEAERALASFWIEDRGFAVIEANNRGLGTFGPTGVAKAFRGQGSGRTLLIQSLLELKRLGYAKAIIPWTDAVEFYRRSSGAEPAHRFVTYTSRP